jgi:hypothetical protein
MQESLNVVAKWAENEGMKIRPHKTTTVPFTNRRKIEGLDLSCFMVKNLKCWARSSTWE